MTDCSKRFEFVSPISPEEQYIVAYLKDIHNNLSKEELLNLHTFFYWIDVEVCPICNEWLVMRNKPEATT